MGDLAGSVGFQYEFSISDLALPSDFLALFEHELSEIDGLNQVVGIPSYSWMYLVPNANAEDFAVYASELQSAFAAATGADLSDFSFSLVEESSEAVGLV